MPWYTRIRTTLTATMGTLLCASRVTNLALLVSAILTKRTLTLVQLTRAYPLPLGAPPAATPGRGHLGGVAARGPSAWLREHRHLCPGVPGPLSACPGSGPPPTGLSQVGMGQRARVGASPPTSQQSLVADLRALPVPQPPQDWPARTPSAPPARAGPPVHGRSPRQAGAVMPSRSSSSLAQRCSATGQSPAWVGHRVRAPTTGMGRPGILPSEEVRAVLEPRTEVDRLLHVSPGWPARPPPPTPRRWSPGPPRPVRPELWSGCGDGRRAHRRPSPPPAAARARRPAPATAAHD